MKGKLKQDVKLSCHKDIVTISRNKKCFGGMDVGYLKHWFKLTYNFYCRQVFFMLKSEQDKRSTDRVIISMKKIFFKKSSSNRDRRHMMLTD